jgi:hypothetical protein
MKRGHEKAQNIPRRCCDCWSHIGLRVGNSEESSWFQCRMAETWGDVVETLKAIAAERGKAITDEEAKEVITREYRELFPEGFDADHPAPEISSEEYENLADLTDLDQ